MNKYIVFFLVMAGLFACDTPDADIVPAKSTAAAITRFRVYQNVNVFYDAAIDDSTIVVVLPGEMDRSSLRPEVLVSAGASVSPESGGVQDFTGKVDYTVISENGEVAIVYEVEVKNELNE